MARQARSEVFAPDEVAVVHVMNRTVRGCFLLGNDRVTGKNYDHRKEWIEAELERLAGHFGIDLIGYSILSNHFHSLLRSRPDIVETWNDFEVAKRWLQLCPKGRKRKTAHVEPSEKQLSKILSDAERVKQIRSRLSDISWWMRLLSQKIGRMANHEDNEVGKFWQARYRAVRLLDETAVLACAAYIDLNLIRAAMAETVEESDFTSAQQRALQLRDEYGGMMASSEFRGEEVASTSEHPLLRSTSRSRDRPLVKKLKTIASALCPVQLDGEGSGTGPCVHHGGRRASDKGFLPLTAAKYLELLDWTARELRSDKRGVTPEEAAPIFERLGIDGPTWCELTRNFDQMFSIVAGMPPQIDAARSRKRGQRYYLPAQTRSLLAPPEQQRAKPNSV
jgi:hypothetical protein